MRIKRIHGTDMRSALERVRQELGPDAVIISTRTLGTTVEERRGGLTGIEVVAGVDDQPERSAVAQARAVVQQTQRAAEGEPSPVAPAAARAAYALTRAAGGEQPPRPSAGLPLAAVQAPAISTPTFPRVDRNGDDVPDLDALTPALEALAARRNQGLRSVGDDTAAAMTSGTVTPIRLSKTPAVSERAVPAPAARGLDQPALAAGAEDFSQALRSAARGNPTFPLAEESGRLSASRSGAARGDDTPFARVSRPRLPLPAHDGGDDDDVRPVSLRGRGLSFEPARSATPTSRRSFDEDDDEGMPPLAPGLLGEDDDLDVVYDARSRSRNQTTTSRVTGRQPLSAQPEDEDDVPVRVPRRPSRSVADAWDGDDAEGYFDAPAPRAPARVDLPPRLALVEDDIEARLHAATRAQAMPPAPRMPAAPQRMSRHQEPAATRPNRKAAATSTEHTQLPPPPMLGEGGRGGQGQHLPSPMQAAEDAYELLCRAGLTESVAEAALEAAIGMVPASALSRSDVLAEAALSRVIAGLPEAPALTHEGLRGRTVFFAGPAGSGKTSALLKAAVLLRRAGADVAIACADTLRIGTPEQMQRYGDLLRMPVALIHAADDLAAALADAPRGRITLVDTPAAGLHRAADGDDLPALIAAVPAPLVVLAVPAGTSTADLHRLAVYGEHLGAAAVAITKLDEAEAPGAALNVLAGLRLPPLLVSDGRDLLGDVTTPAPAELAAAALDAALPQPATTPSSEGWVYQGRRLEQFE